jgi:hypothetical protein
MQFKTALTAVFGMFVATTLLPAQAKPRRRAEPFATNGAGRVIPEHMGDRSAPDEK